MQPELVVVQDPLLVARTVALRLGRCIEDAVREREWCDLALPGGAFVGRIYDELAELQLPWPQVEFYFTDERCVPPDHPASNFGEANDRLFSNPRIGAHQVHRIEAERSDHDAVAESYAEELPEAFDAVLLEMGVDGHTAALFPGSAAAREEERRVLALEAPLKPRKRITLTPPVLRAARRLFVVVTGREKAAMVQRALRGELDPLQIPAQLARGGTWILDRPAAALLG